MFGADAPSWTFSIICYRTNGNKSRQWWRRLGRRRAFLKACCNMPNADIRATWATTLMMITITGLLNGRCEPWSQVFLDTGCEFLYVCWLFTRSLWWWTLASPGWFLISYHRVLVIQFELESSIKIPFFPPLRSSLLHLNKTHSYNLLHCKLLKLCWDFLSRPY